MTLDSRPSTAAAWVTTALSLLVNSAACVAQHTHTCEAAGTASHDDYMRRCFNCNVAITLGPSRLRRRQAATVAHSRPLTACAVQRTAAQQHVFVCSTRLRFQAPPLKVGYMRGNVQLLL
jgi:hypothetical protein